MLARIPARTGGSDEAGKYSSDLESVQPTQFALLISPACGEAGGRLHTFFIMKSNNPYALIRPVCACVFSLSIVCEIQAQEKNDSTKLLPPVVVTAARIEQLQTDALPHTTVITAEDITNLPVSDIPSLLRSQAGLQITQSGGAGQPSSIFMRGAAPGQMVVLIDGVQIGQQGFTTAPMLEHIPLSQIDSIEIVRGNVSSIYGSGAVGGVIQIFTKKGKLLNKTVDIEFGSRGHQMLSTSIGNSVNNWRYFISVSAMNNGGISSINTSLYPKENPDRDGYRNRTIIANLSNEWTNKREFGLRVFSSSGEYDFDGGGSGLQSDLASGLARQESIALYSNDRFSENWTSQVNISDTRILSRSMSMSVLDPTTSYFIKDQTNISQIQWKNTFSLNSNWSLLAGSDLVRQNFHSYSEDFFSGISNAPTKSRSNTSIYTGLNGKFEKNQWQLNMRHDQIGGSGSEMTGYIGYGYMLNTKYKFIASSSTAFNAPTLAQIYDTKNGNPDLKPELARSHELGIQYSDDINFYRVTTFLTNTKNQFAIDPANCFSGNFLSGCPSFNLSKASNQGVEISGSSQILGNHVQASVTMQKPIDDSTGEALVRRAKVFGSLSIVRPIKEWRFSANLYISDPRPDKAFIASSTQNVQLSGYALLNIGVSRKIHNKLTLHARIENLLEKEYQTVYGYNQLPRSLFVGLNWQQ